MGQRTQSQGSGLLMASVNDRWWVKQPDGSKKKSDRYGSGMRWQVRYRNPEGQSRNKSFIRQVDAERFASSIEYELNRGSFFDPKLGQVKFKDLAEKWFKTRTANPTTIKQNDIHLRHHILPYWGEKPIGTIKNSDIQSWIAQLNSAGLSARYVRLVFANFRLVLEVAVRDDLLTKNPAIARNFSFPPVSNQRLEVWSPDQFKAILEALPPEAKLMALLGGTCGLRQGEIFGVRVQDLDLERGVITVRQQITALDYKPTPVLTKNRRTRSVPLPSFVADLLKEHLTTHEPLEGERTLEPSVGGLIFYLREQKPINKNYFNTAIWLPAIKRAGLPRSRINGMHGLRHFCASVWLSNGVSIKAVSTYLGHSDPGFTLRVYTHLMPTDDSQVRNIFDFVKN